MMWMELWRDEGGAILSSELTLLSVLTVLGMTTGMTAMRDSVTTQLAETAGSVVSIDPSYRYTGLRYTGPINGSSATVNGSAYVSTVGGEAGSDYHAATVLSAVEPK